MTRFTDQVAVVTGAGSGIGRATALALAREGAFVAVGDLVFERAEATVAALAEVGGAGMACRVDVTAYDQVEAMAEAVLGHRGRIDVLVSCAGWDHVAPFVETGPDLWDRLIAVNYRGQLASARAVLPAMIRQGGGAIVTVASDSGRVGSSGEAVYSGTKGAVIAFTKALAREVARHGVRVNCVAPGLTDTPLLGEVRTGHEKLMDAIVRATPLGRVARAEEIAEAILFLASGGASFVTGQTLSVSGGLTMA